MKRYDIALVCASISLLSLSAAYAAGIQCDDDFQTVQGQPISTPYCRDGYLARVAREHGFNASERAVRASPSFKEELCRSIASDIRVQTACAEVLPDHGGVAESQEAPLSSRVPSRFMPSRHRFVEQHILCLWRGASVRRRKGQQIQFHVVNTQYEKAGAPDRMKLRTLMSLKWRSNFGLFDQPL